MLCILHSKPSWVTLIYVHSRVYTENIGQHFIKNLDLGCALRLAAHVTIAYLHLLYLLCLGRPFSLPRPSQSAPLPLFIASYCLVGHAPKLRVPCQDRARQTENAAASHPAHVSTVSRPNPRQRLTVRGQTSRTI